MSLSSADCCTLAREWVDRKPARRSFSYGHQAGCEGVWLQLTDWYGVGHHYRLRVDLGVGVDDIFRAEAAVARRVKMEGGKP